MRTIATSMGQYRYPGSGAVESISINKEYKPIAMSTDSDTDSTSFKDVQFSLASGNFVKNQDYYFKVSIPQDMNYDMTFDIQLYKKEGSGPEIYQFIKRVTINRGGTGENAYNVVLYEDLDGNIKAMVPLPYIEKSVGIHNSIYYEESTGRYFIYNKDSLKDNKYERWTKFNDLTVIASWKEEAGNNFGVFEMTFRPIDDGFTHIHLKMVRTAEDYNIQRVDSTDENSSEFGRKLDIKQITAKLYRITNLINEKKINPPLGELSRIGVWSHPGLIMMINGEEIRVTANGYYELDALPITSLGIVARNANEKIIDENGKEIDYGYRDFFTIDYEYETEE